MSRDKPALASRPSAFSRVVGSLGTLLGGLVRPLLKDRFSAFLLVASVALTVLFFSLLGGTQPSSSGREIPFSTMLQYSEAKSIVRATMLDQDSRVVADTSGGAEFWAAYPESDAQTTALMTSLRENGAVVTVDQQAGKPAKAILVQFLVPILLLVCLFALFTRIGADGGAGGIASFSNFKGKGRKRGAKSANSITFANVAGAGEAVVELREIRDYLEDPSKYLALGAAPPKGVLLVGPPGTGKTLLAKATAGEADAAFFSVSGAEFVESLVGVGAARVRDLFAKARKMAPAIIFIDEVDAAGRKRGAGIGQGNDEREQTLNQLLVEMDGFGGDSGLVVMAATNRPDILDPALLRPGRFDRQVVVDTPDVHGRYEILQLHARKKPIDPSADLMEVAKLCPGFSGAELANVVNEAALLTVREGRETIDQATLEESIDRVVAGPAKKSHVLSVRERQVIAIHESSHAVVARAVGQSTGSGAQKISIVARGRTLGTSASQLVDKDVTVMQEHDLQRQLCAILAGAAGEKVQFGVVSTAVNDDLHAATNLARSMVTSFGMSAKLGMVTIGEQGGEVFLGASLQELGSVGPATLDLIDNEVERIVAEALERATVILQANWSAVREITQVLLDHETVSGLALEALLTPVTLESDLPVNGRRSVQPPVE
ncbi:ATP-dependent zinc metalloprotease FtsH [Solirubrobacter sp. CPCC 204708]|uniref:ATP-dependent zinc metalloprotease FtsH n=1 Tax=Solirubrobacter deserti TaxID=2282478 RepID=A0ABT4RUP3_9ACTN|nr:ATP-dependent zinc metalloprotease FtsH [Solirubrobacter deserti]MBE2320026.1 ATP-dependent zinc metalloprotease FtsH [Solirubrobacter deserti]MDA0141970.1 ATP-dependent zinc metalloprotease FtsH [Solirubrobacter deserti]